MSFIHRTQTMTSPAAMSNNPFSQQSMAVGQLAAAPIPALTPQQVAQMYNGYNSQSAQNQAAHQYGQMIAGLGRSQAVTARWMFDGQIMNLVAFANEVFGEDTPEATHFVLKHSK